MLIGLGQLVAAASVPVMSEVAMQSAVKQLIHKNIQNIRQLQLLLCLLLLCVESVKTSTIYSRLQCPVGRYQVLTVLEWVCRENGITFRLQECRRQRNLHKMDVQGV